MRIALATCSALPHLDPDDIPLAAALEARGAQVDVAVWDDPAVLWGRYDLVVIRSTWDYAPRRSEFVAWARGVSQMTRLSNPFPVIRWNSDKHYLRELDEAGVPVVPTIWLEPDRHLSGRALHTRFPAGGDFVIKPAVSAGSLDTGRYTAIDAESRGLAIQHAKRLLGDERTVMVQRYLTSVDTAGERAHIFISGQYSHSIRKGAMLDGPDVAVDGTYRPETISSITADDAEIEVARTVVRTARRLLTEAADGVPVESDPFLYARVDLVHDDDGRPVLLELEMVEPSLFFGYGDGALDRFADAVAVRAEGGAVRSQD
ncbi:hypothetical protein Q6348_08305 [Isoptericola sp. b441]|uniref:ATP-grasp domain-containing protein n=1 Tax=Actinotalea lenta TaxID=3064654 RepID=A0ABT9D8H9_9CELL|nr:MULTISPECIES: hypothetical protein [unclassified Isoptericola]MDO8107197.1 hypothetical protein [Isoptericola sp. b441]MDO8121125.1 hypothetical protein [Isoptericola sp. b490]